jgi:hypothetical protein
MDYEDFVLQLTPGSRGGYMARVVASPAGQAEGSFAIPVRDEELAALLRVENARAAARNLSLAEPEGLGEPSLRTLGDRLFEALFSLHLRSRLDESLGLLSSREECGLRLRLQMSLDDPALGRLQALPWEFLFRAEQGAFLALSSRVVVVRSPSLPLAGRRPPATLPLRLLAISCEPPGLPRLNLAREQEALQRTCRAGLAELQVLRQPTLDGLRRTLLAQRPHILHVMGHGDFAAETGEGRLFLADGNGGAASIDGTLLADHLRDCPSLLLVFLNACQTARSAAPNPFAGVATALLQAGVPAVIAMQFPIRDDAAVAFSGAVYRQLGQGEPVEAAVAEGRLAIRRLLPTSMEWGTPVLFLRASDGRISRRVDTPFSSPVLPGTAQAPPSRRWVRAGAAVAVSLALAVVSFALKAGYRSGPAPAPVQPSDTKQAHDQEPSPAKDPTPGREPAPIQEKKRRETPPSQPDRKEVKTSIREPSSPPSRPPSAQTFTVSSQTPVFVPEIHAELSAEFLDAFGQPGYRIFFSPQGGSFAGSEPLLGRDTVTFDTQRGKVSIDVLAIDWKRQTVVVRPHFQAG